MNPKCEIDYLVDKIFYNNKPNNFYRKEAY